eukprot:TRINITY_DN754_c0_g1_i2.p1 TRINITY_DN754_c0_g1~~TRINITY_DN754_c0_g1_i2.p1  ORF type:complete len:160 (+),score=7.77 TRINITY_DN754_c0_g1_i2:12-491(+)
MNHEKGVCRASQGAFILFCRSEMHLANLFQFLLGAEVVRVPAFLLAAVVRAEGQASIALAADQLVAVVLASQRLQRRLDGAAHQAQHKVQRRLLLDVVVRERAPILKLLAGKNETLLVWGDALLVLDLLLHVLDGVRGLDLEGDRLQACARPRAACRRR